MTTSWDSKGPEDQQRAEAMFDALSNFDRIQRAMQAPAGSARPGFAELYHFATDPGAVMTDQLQTELADNPRLREDLDRLLDRTSVYHFPRVAAASSGNIDSREGDGFKLRLKESRADASQLYVILDLGEYGEEDPVALVIKDEAGLYQKHPLPVPVNGMIQLVTDEESDLVKALRDVKTELYLQ